MTVDEQIWRGSSQADRASGRRSRLLAAGYDLLGTAGASATTVRATCRSAELSAKYFYEAFTDRDELMIAVYDSVLEQLTARIARQRPGTISTAKDQLRQSFQSVAEFLEEDPRRARIVFTEPLTDPTLQAHARITMGGFVPTLAPQVDVIADSSDNNRTMMALNALGGALLATFTHWLAGNPRVEPGVLADFCVELVESTPGLRIGEIL